MVVPQHARAGILSDLLGLSGTTSAAESSSTANGSGNLATLSLPTAALNPDPAPATGGGDVTVVDGGALVPNEGPSGTLADIEKPANGIVSTYIVQPGDTLSSIAKLFPDTTMDTIRWANDIPRNGMIQAGQKLIIFPIPGYPYTVQKGDTLASIAKRFGGDPTDIASYNGLDTGPLAAGTQIFIPNGEAPTPSNTGMASSGKSSGSARVGGTVKIGSGKSVGCGAFIPNANNPAEPAHNVGPQGSCAEIAYYIAPLSHYTQTQGIHGYNAVDLAAPSGTPIMASADGEVIVARAGGWNGGYGSYVVIQHDNGSQTLYSHMSQVAAYDGETVVQGQVIGYVGASGEATGPHVHFEIRNGIRNPF